MLRSAAFRKLSVFLSFGVLFTLSFAGSITEAYASSATSFKTVNSVDGTGGGGNNSSGGGKLFRYGNGKPGVAWTNMSKATGGKLATAHIKKKNHKTKCKNSEYIWFVGHSTWGLDPASALKSKSTNQTLWRGKAGGGGRNFDTDMKKSYDYKNAVSKIIKKDTAYVCSWEYQKKPFKCSDLAEWGTHLSKPGVKASKEFDTKAKAKTGCLLYCPDKNFDLKISGAKVKNANKTIKSSSVNKGKALSDTQKKTAGDRCFTRETFIEEKNDESKTFGKKSDGSWEDSQQTSEIVAEFGWRTSVTDGRSSAVVNQAHIANGGVIQATSKTEHTPFGLWLQDLFKNGDIDKDIFALIESKNIEEMNKDKDRPSVVMSEANKTAFARGGVVDVSSFSTNVPLTSKASQPKLNWRWRDVRTQYEQRWNGKDASKKANLTWTTKATKHCRPLGSGTKTKAGDPERTTFGTCAGTGNWGSWKYAYNNVSAWENNGPATYVSSMAVAAQTPVATSYWQAMSNHCYADGFNSERTNGGGNLNVPNGDTSKNFSGSVIGPVTTTDNRRWGAGAGATDEANFYDRECAYFGVRAKDDNTEISGSEKRAEVEQTFFRDNKPADFKVDLFVPAYPADSVVKYNGEKAVSTTVSRWNGGSPDLKGGAIERGKGGAFMMSVDSGDIFDYNNTEDAPEQKNWDVSNHSGRNVAQVDGQHNVFQVRGSWPSDADAPQVFTVKWEYEPMVSNRIPTTLGFGANAATSKYTLEDVAVPVQGKVLANFAEDKSEAKTQDQVANTGTNVSNNLDGLDAFRTAGGLVTNNAPATRWSQSPTSFSDYFTALRFVRAAGN